MCILALRARAYMCILVLRAWAYMCILVLRARGYMCILVLRARAYMCILVLNSYWLGSDFASTFRVTQGTNARKVNFGCVYSAYISKPVLAGRNL